MDSFVFNNYETASGATGLKNAINRMFAVNSCKVRAHVCALNKDGRASKRKGVVVDVWHFRPNMREVIIYAPYGKLNQTGNSLFELLSSIDFDYPARISIRKEEPLVNGIVEF